MTGKDGVFNFLENRIITHYPAAHMILQGQMPAPRTAIVYPTYICNQNCLWCEYSEDNSQYHTMMSNEQLRRVMLELRDIGVRGVEFCGGGEPTLHPMLPELIRDMKGWGMSTGLLTNGTRLKGDLAEAVVDCSSYVRVGFDSAHSEMFDKVKRPRTAEAGFDAVCENVANLLELRKQRGGKCLISMKVILCADNFAEIEDCVKLATKLGVDSLQFKAARLCPTELNEEQALLAQAEIDRVRALYLNVNVIGSVKKLEMKQQCWLTPLQIMIDTLGDAFLCCYYRHRKASHTFGNVFEESVHEVWYSQQHWDAIRAIKPAECNVLDCRFVHYNRIMTQLLVENDAQFEFI